MLSRFAVVVVGVHARCSTCARLQVGEGDYLVAIRIEQGEHFAERILINPVLACTECRGDELIVRQLSLVVDVDRIEDTSHLGRQQLWVCLHRT